MWGAFTRREQGELLRHVLEQVEFDGESEEVTLAFRFGQAAGGGQPTGGGGGVKTTKKISTGRGARGKKVAAEPGPKPSPAGRVPRITKLMALAIKFDQMIRDGVVKDQAELARLGFVTRARVTQIMNLLNLAPEIQTHLLTSRLISSGKDRITERQLRGISDQPDWQGQLQTWGTFAALTAMAN